MEAHEEDPRRRRAKQIRRSRWPELQGMEAPPPRVLGGDSTPGTMVAYRMTVRQLEALIRLSEAIARSHLERVVLPAHVHMAVRLLKTSIISVESSEVDLSYFQDAEDGTNVPADNDAGQPTETDAAPQQEGAENEQAADAGKKKLDITEEHFQRVTQALVMPLRQHEESVMKDGNGMAGMKQGDLIIWYVEQQNAQGTYSSTAEVKEEVKCIKAIIEADTEGRPSYGHR